MKFNANNIHYQSKVKFSIIKAIILNILNRLINMGRTSGFELCSFPFSG